ncbi:MAG: J domain-containing protein [Deltaproteobacteria bacterium]|nr:J domain-containing protein [Deltaproteobacteria bacterium]
MKRAPEKNFYTILGVASNATIDELREAYLARTRVIHPDRFDPQQQPNEWKKANEMLAELNEAYSILRNKTSRAQYDTLRTGESKQKSPPTASAPSSRQPTSHPTPYKPLNKSQLRLIYGLTVFLCAAGLLVLLVKNNETSRVQLLEDSVSAKNQAHPTTSILIKKSIIPENIEFPYLRQGMPDSGDIRAYTNLKRIAPFEIKADQGNHYLLKIVDQHTKKQVLTVFVRSGTTVNVDVPLGTFEIKYASGETWYGYEYLFGPETSYSKADKAFTFKKEGDHISGYTITLYKVTRGNLHTYKISQTDF